MAATLREPPVQALLAEASIGLAIGGKAAHDRQTAEVLARLSRTRNVLKTVLLILLRDLADRVFTGESGPPGDRTPNPRIKRERVAASHSLYQRQQLHG
jgi:hypothetical protein